MITNETRARLIGWKTTDKYRPQIWRDSSGICRCSTPFDTDANAVAELRAFVRARGKEVAFLEELEAVSSWIGASRNLWSYGSVISLLDATPAQQCAAFDTVFKDELEKL